MKINKKRLFALGRLKQGEMNKTEAEYKMVLELSRISGEVLEYGFEKIKFRLADNTFYTPDFYVMKKDMSIEFHEVKGFWQDDARVKIKVASSLFPMFLFKAVKKKGKNWEYEDF